MSLTPRISSSARTARPLPPLGPPLPMGSASSSPRSSPSLRPPLALGLPLPPWRSSNSQAIVVHRTSCLRNHLRWIHLLPTEDWSSTLSRLRPPPSSTTPTTAQRDDAATCRPLDHLRCGHPKDVAHRDSEARRPLGQPPSCCVAPLPRASASSSCCTRPGKHHVAAAKQPCHPHGTELP